MMGLLENSQRNGLLDERTDLNVAIRLIDGVMNRVAHDLVITQIDVDKDHYIEQTATFLCRALGAKS